MPTKILAIVPDTMGTDRPTPVGWSSSALEREKKTTTVTTNAFCKDTLHHIPPDTHDCERPTSRAAHLSSAKIRSAHKHRPATQTAVCQKCSEAHDGNEPQLTSPPPPMTTLLLSSEAAMGLLCGSIRSMEVPPVYAHRA